jgi:ubiquitin C
MKALSKIIRFRIIVKAFTGKQVTLNVKRTDQIKDVKVKIKNWEGIPPSLQRLIFEGKELKGENTLQDYSIHDNSILIVFRRPPDEMDIFVKTLT